MPETRGDRLSDKAAELDAPGIVLRNNGADSSSRVAHPSSGGFFYFAFLGGGGIRKNNAEFGRGGEKRGRFALRWA
jgi:hypothetical protein